MKWCITVDIGTTATKVSVFTIDGQCVFSTAEEYSLEFPQEEWVEINFYEYYNAFRRGWKKFLAQNSIPQAEVTLICTSSQGESIVAVDRQGEPLSNGIVWLDNRARKEAQKLSSIIENQFFYQRTGIPEIGPNWPITKIMWIRQNNPALYASAYKFLLAEDFTLYKLAKEFATNKSVACTTGFFDIIIENWWQELLKEVNISADLLPKIVLPGSVIGHLHPQTAKELSIQGECLVVCGGMDQACGAIGAGNFMEGVISETTGTALAVAATIQNPRFDLPNKIPYYCHSLKERVYLALPYCPTSGIILKWFRDNFFDSPKNYEELIQMAEDIPPGSEGLILVPYFAGSLSPDYNPNARGIFFGATLSTKRAHFVRSILEGVAFALRENVELIESMGVTTQRIVSLGGGAKSKVWLQIKADVLQRDIFKPHMEESTSLGAFILGAVAVGYFPTLQIAYERLAKEGTIFYPRRNHQMVHESSFQKFRQIYARCREIFLLEEDDLHGTKS